MSPEVEKVKAGEDKSALGVTQRYNFYETYKSFTAYAGFTALPQRLRELSTQAKEDNTYPELPNITSKNEIIKIAIDMLEKINPELKKLAIDAWNNPLIDTENIELAPANNSLSSTGKCEKDPDGRMRITITANKDITGVMAVAQTLVDAKLYSDYYKYENEKTEKRADFAKETVHKFIGYAMIDAMATAPYMDISPEQKDFLVNEHLKSDVFQYMPAMENDLKLYEAFMEAHRDDNLDLDNMKQDDLNKLFEEFMECNAHPELQEALDARLKDIAEEDKTTSYITGKVLEGVVALNTIDQVQNSPEEDPVKKLVEGAIQGQKVQDITGKTPAELAQDTPELIEKIEGHEISALPEGRNELEDDMQMILHKTVNPNT